MKAFLARFRRLFYGGTISLILTLVTSIFTKGKGYFDLWSDGIHVRNFDSAFELFLAVTPIIYFLLVVISSAYIRSKGQSAAFQRTKPFISTVLACIGSDVASPFKCIAGFFGAMFKRFPSVYPQDMVRKSKFVSIRRFIWMIMIVAFCAYGLVRLNDFPALIQHFMK